MTDHTRLEETLQHSLQEAEQAVQRCVRDGFAASSSVRAQLDELTRLNSAQTRMADYGSAALTAWHIKRAGQLSASLVQQCRQARWNTLAHHLAQAPGVLAHHGWVLVLLSLVTVALVFKQHVALTMAPWQPANGSLIAMSLMALFLQVAALPGVLLHKAQHSSGPLACFYMMLAVSVVILLLWLANGRATELAAGAALAMMVNVLIYGAACLAMQAKRQPVGQGVYNNDTEWLFSNDDDEMELALAGIEPYSSMYGLSDHE